MKPLTTAEAARLGRGLARRARRTARRVRNTTPLYRLSPPMVSIILPIYNVEEYLAECLDSIAAQTYGDYEVVVVDDGSPDGSRSIAERYARSDPRIRIITRENGGLGAARNTGVRNARGRFLSFVDSDDLLPDNALQVLVDSALATGSEIVVGGLRRFDGNRSWRPEWMREVHLHQREGVTVEQFPPLLRNLYTCNKLFRHDFWRAQGLSFREGVAYEDQPLVTQLYARARRIDVLHQVVYDYRARDDHSSISQQTASLRDLRDRVSAWRLTRATLQQEFSPRLYQGWLQTLFDAHFHWYLNSPGAEDDTYWHELQQAVVELTADAPAEIWAATAPDKRVLLELTRQDRRGDAMEFVAREGRRPERWPSTTTDRGVLLHLPFFGDPDLEEDLFLLRPEQIRVAHAVESVRWLDGADAGTFEATGWAYLTKVDLARHASSVSIVLRSSEGAEHEFPSSGPVDPAYPPPEDDEWCDYRSGTFRTKVRLAELAEREPDVTTWDVLVRVSAAGFTVTEPVTHVVRSGSAGVIPAGSMPNGDSLVTEWRVKRPLRFRRRPNPLHVEQPSLHGRTVTATVCGELASQVTGVAAQSPHGRVDAHLDRSATGLLLRLDLPKAPLPAAALQNITRWSVEATTADGQSHALAVAEPPTGTPLGTPVGTPVGTSVGGGRVLSLHRTGQGVLCVDESAAIASADRLEISPAGELVVGGTLLGGDARDVALVTRNKKTRSVGPRSTVEGERFTVRHPLRHEAFRFGDHPLPAGEHDVSLRVWSGDGKVTDVALGMRPQVTSRLPVRLLTAVHDGRVLRGREGNVRVSLGRPLGEARGRLAQRQLKTAPVTGGLVRGVLMRSYFGEQATDNGVAIQRELQRRGSDLPVYWAVQDHSVPVPEGGVPVVVHSREWYQLLGSVAYYVDNMYQPSYHRKRDGQVVVQTFHGYPFKQMGHPHWRSLQLSQARIDAYDERAREWDYLVSPATYATPLLRRDFAYDGEVLEIGYPRNDVLLSPDADGIRAATRRSLGLAESQTAVLYAPTFRDYLARRDNRAAMADFLDLNAAADGLGDDAVILVRGHAFNARSRHRVGNQHRIVDVTDYPEVSDLYLAADAAIVDYSSVRFDFGVTGKPMIFHVPDLQRYQDTRGWLFDFEPTAPGPLVETTDEVVAQLKDLDGVRARHAGQYDEFRSRFLDLEDGNAAGRFVDAVFVPRGDA